MKKIPDGSVDLVLTDPPYGTTACKWDTIIPFEPMWEQLKRVTKKNGAIVLFGSQPFTSALVMSNPKMFKYEWVWKKNMAGGFAQAKNKPMPNHENIVVFSTGVTVHANQTQNRVPYFPQGLRKVDKVIKKAKLTNSDSAFGIRPSHKKEFVQEYTGFPMTVLEIPVQRDGLHPTQKPLSLMEYLIKTYTNENETVLDFTMGSGTTGVACKNLNRNFIGIELDETYYQIAKQRIENTP